MADQSDVGAALRGLASRFEDRRQVDTSTPHQWTQTDFEDPDNPPPLPPETPLGIAAGIRDIRRPTADEVMRFILENVSQGDEPMTNSNVRRRK